VDNITSYGNIAMIYCQSIRQNPDILPRLRVVNPSRVNNGCFTTVHRPYIHIFWINNDHRCVYGLSISPITGLERSPWRN